MCCFSFEEKFRTAASRALPSAFFTVNFLEMPSITSERIGNERPDACEERGTGERTESGRTGGRKIFRGAVHRRASTGVVDKRHALQAASSPPPRLHGDPRPPSLFISGRGVPLQFRAAASRTERTSLSIFTTSFCRHEYRHKSFRGPFLDRSGDRQRTVYNKPENAPPLALRGVLVPPRTP